MASSLFITSSALRLDGGLEVRFLFSRVIFSTLTAPVPGAVLLRMLNVFCCFISFSVGSFGNVRSLVAQTNLTNLNAALSLLSIISKSIGVNNFASLYFFSSNN